MAMVAPRQYIMVAPPTVVAGVGDALRKAFRPERSKPMQMFERLIERLDRLG